MGMPTVVTMIVMLLLVSPLAVTLGY